MAPGGAIRGRKRERYRHGRPVAGRRAGIEYRHSRVLLDEIPAAYKDIDEVMEHAQDLVEVKYVLRRFGNVKGD